MNCFEIKENLFKYSEDELPADTRRAFQEHTRTCQACSAIVADFISFELLIGNEKIIKPNAFAGTRILQSLESEMELQNYHQRIRFSRLLQPALVTLSLILALLIGFVIGRQGGLNINAKAANTQQVETLKSDLYISHFIDEEQTLLSNK